MRIKIYVMSRFCTLYFIYDDVNDLFDQLTGKKKKKTTTFCVDITCTSIHVSLVSLF